jgi:hypothetical protein
MGTDRERFSVVFEVQPDPAGQPATPAAVKLKALLKVALRRLGLKAVHVQGWQPGRPPQGPGDVSDAIVAGGH